MNQFKWDILQKAAQMGDCLIFHHNGDDIVSDGIEWFENGTVSNIAMYVGGGRGLITEFCAEGATVSRLEKYNSSKYSVYLERIKDITVTQAALMKDSGYRSVYNHNKYDYTAYIGFILFNLARKIGLAKLLHWNNTFGEMKHEVCSTAYNAWAQAGGIELFPELGNKQVTPQDLFKSERLEIIAIAE